MKLTLSKGYVAVVDDNDPKQPWKFKWNAYVAKRKDGTVRTVYAIRKRHHPDGRWVTQLLHRFLLGLHKRETEGDHKDGNGLNNRRSNLRVVTHAQNGRNRRRGADNTSGYIGVVWVATHKLWAARIKVDRVPIHLGYFSNKKEAIVARKKAELKLYKGFARGRP